jgi:hypothetical protein
MSNGRLKNGRTRTARRWRRRYDSLASFYANPIRRRSAERDLGLRWRAAGGATYRAAIVADTGELYTFEHVSSDGTGGAVQVIARVPVESVDALLAGWSAVCGEPESYEWLCSRARCAGEVRVRGGRGDHERARAAVDRATASLLPA